MAAKFMQLVLTPAVQARAGAILRQSIRSSPTLPSATRSPTTKPPSSRRATASTWPRSNSDGWPYLQHRGGPPGFLKVLGPNQLGFADFKGNRQLAQHRQPRRRRPRLALPHGLPAPRAAENPRPRPRPRRPRTRRPRRPTQPHARTAQQDRAPLPHRRRQPTTGTARNTSPRASPRRRWKNMPRR